MSMIEPRPIAPGDTPWEVLAGEVARLRRDLEDLKGTALARAGGGSGDTAWHEIGAGGEPAFQNSWVNHGVSFPTAAYRKLSSGLVILKGLIKSGVIGSAAFTLPAGYRPVTPGQPHTFPAVAQGPALAQIYAYQSGDIVPATGSSTTWTSLDGVVFYAEA